MTAWTEQTLRVAASWKAFKEGAALLAGGLVSDAKRTSAGWQGTISSSRRPIRVSVTVRSATDLETRCSCPENRATGGFCAHAVASGLAVLATEKTPAQDLVKRPPDVPPDLLAARDLVLPPNWREGLSRGSLSLTASVSRRPPEGPADRRLMDWLKRERLADKPVLHLCLDASRLSGFLNAIIGHPMVGVGSGGTMMEISAGHRLRLAECTRTEDHVLLRAAGGAGWILLDDSAWQAGETFLRRAGQGNLPAPLRKAAADLFAGNPSRMALRDFLTHLDAWQDWLDFPVASWLEALHFIPATPEFHLVLDGAPGQILARLTVAYENLPPAEPVHGGIAEFPRVEGDICRIRDINGEKSAVRKLESFGFRADSPGLWQLNGESAGIDFLAHMLPKIQQEWTVTRSESFSRAARQVVVVHPKLEILGSGEDWLSFDYKFQATDGNVISGEEIRRLFRSGGRSGKLSGGRQVVLADDYCEVLDPLLAELDLRQQNGRYEVTGCAVEVVRKICENLDKPLNDQVPENIFTFSKPATLRAELRPYQERGAAWMADRIERYGGALLADDMGLGKTLQAIACIERFFAADEADSGVVLVVATATLLGNWRAEFARFAPARRIRVLHGATREEERERLMPGEVAITSYGTLVRDLAWHLRRNYRAVVVDEASLMRNPDTDHARAVSKLQSKRRLALTGTPVENGVRDLWSVFRFIQPGWLGTRERFRELYEQPIAEGGAATPVIRRLKLKTSPFMLRRTKEQVAPELPSKILIDEYCDLSGEQSAMYRDLLAEGRRQCESLEDGGNAGAARMKMLTALLRLRQVCCDLALLGNDRLKRLPLARRSAKTERLLELLEEAVSGNHRVLVFSQFRKQLLEIEQCVSERGWASLRLDGQTRNRQELVERFQEADGPPVFLISLKAGGYGLNLTAADTVIHFDPWWNPAAEAQATDRAHRIGQTRPVTVYRLLTRGTVEEKVLGLQSRKSAVAVAIDEAGTADVPDLSLGELRKLLSAE
jgi:superfamily II DNA or RNA helicase